MLNPVPAQQARLWLAQGDLESALRWTREQDLGVDDEPAYGREPGYLVLARVLLAQSLTGPAVSLLERLHAAAASQDRVGSVIEAGALLALARAADGDQDGATGALATALGLGCRRGYVRVFADEGPPWRPCSPRSSRHKAPSRNDPAVPPGHLTRLQRAFKPGGTPASAESEQITRPYAPGLIDQLTSREVEVLTMMAAGQSNKAIATQLVVSIDTVKKHVSHMMEKLGATNRTQAVARARGLDLIS